MFVFLFDVFIGRNQLRLVCARTYSCFRYFHHVLALNWFNSFELHSIKFTYRTRDHSSTHKQDSSFQMRITWISIYRISVRYFFCIGFFCIHSSNWDRSKHFIDLIHSFFFFLFFNYLRMNENTKNRQITWIWLLGVGFQSTALKSDNWIA